MLASKWHIDWTLFWQFSVGLTLVIASACVFNNFIDRDLDKKMERTKKRVMPTGEVKAANAAIYGTALGAAGFWLLSYTNWLTVLIVFVAFVDYVVIYGFAKRRTLHSTLIGTIPGAASLVAGYTAVTGSFDITAFLLFVIMLAWQMVHFYAIAIYRLNDYKAAGMPVLPSKVGIDATRAQMLAYMAVFIVSICLLAIAGSAGVVFLIAGSLLGVGWLWQTLQGYNKRDSAIWARGVFKTSLMVVIALSVLIALGSVLP